MVPKITNSKGITRRNFLAGSLVCGILGLSGVSLFHYIKRLKAETFIGKVENYEKNIASVILAGLLELGVTSDEVKGKRVLLKPNLVEVLADTDHINTHPMIIRGAIEAFLRLGASKVLVGEGQGHVRESLYVLEESGLGAVLHEDRIPFIDLNNDSLFVQPNRGGQTQFTSLTFPASLRQVDLIVSMAKMKTHHWAGITLSMKNLFGVMPGIVYGWPKNVLHVQGIARSILDINATLRPHFAIVDGIVGMEGDGPIMGTPRQAGMLVMGRNLPAVDATCARAMGIDPYKIPYLKAADNWLGPINETLIAQRGEPLADVRKNFLLREDIHAQRGLRLG